MVFVTLLVCGKIATGQNEMFKALYIYNFTKNIAWPAGYKKGNFVIGVLGSTPVTTELYRIAKKKKVGNQSISVEKYSSVNEIDKCHIVYIPPQKSSEYEKVKKKIGKKPVLIITDKKGYCNKGAMINFITVNGDQKFEINPNSITANQLKVNSFLTSLGIIVN